MGWIGLGISLVGGVFAATAHPGAFFAMGLGILAIGVGLVGYRRRWAPGSSRLAGAAAMALGGITLVVGAGRFAVAMAALGELDRIL